MYFVELLPNIGACQLALSGDDALRATIRPQSIELQSGSASKPVTVALPRHLQLDPASCIVSGASVRIAMATTHDSPVSKESNNIYDQLGAIRTSQPLSINCKRCSHALIEDGLTFKRVLELPSENWQELASSLCCHNELESIANADIGPRIADLLLSESAIVLHFLDIPAAALRFPPHSAVRPHDGVISHHSHPVQFHTTATEAQCARCRFTVGRVHFQGLFILLIRPINLSIT